MKLHIFHKLEPWMPKAIDHILQGNSVDLYSGNMIRWSWYDTEQCIGTAKARGLAGIDDEFSTCRLVFGWPDSTPPLDFQNPTFFEKNPPIFFFPHSYLWEDMGERLEEPISIQWYDLTFPYVRPIAVSDEVRDTALAQLGLKLAQGGRNNMVLSKNFYEFLEGHRRYRRVWNKIHADWQIVCYPIEEAFTPQRINANAQWLHTYMKYVTEVLNPRWSESLKEDSLIPYWSSEWAVRSALSLPDSYHYCQAEILIDNVCQATVQYSVHDHVNLEQWPHRNPFWYWHATQRNMEINNLGIGALLLVWSTMPELHMDMGLQFTAGDWKESWGAEQYPVWSLESVSEEENDE